MNCCSLNILICGKNKKKVIMNWYIFIKIKPVAWLLFYAIENNEILILLADLSDFTNFHNRNKQETKTLFYFFFSKILAWLESVEVFVSIISLPLNSYTLLSLCLLFDKSLYLLIIILTNYQSNPTEQFVYRWHQFEFESFVFPFLLLTLRNVKKICIIYHIVLLLFSDIYLKLYN